MSKPRCETCYHWQPITHTSMGYCYGVQPALVGMPPAVIRHHCNALPHVDVKVAARRMIDETDAGGPAPAFVDQGLEVEYTPPQPFPITLNTARCPNHSEPTIQEDE